MAYTATTHVEVLLAAAREEIVRADNKASLLLASLGIASGALLAGAIGGTWSPSGLEALPKILCWAAIASLVGTCGSLGYVIYPRTQRRSADPNLIAFFGDVNATPIAELEAAIARTVDAVPQSLYDQLVQTSRIVEEKYRGVKIALWLLLSALVCGLLSLVTAG